MGDSLGHRFAGLGYSVVYGSRNPSSERVQSLAGATGENARVGTQHEAAQAGDIVVLAVPWPAMENVAQNLGSLDGKIVVDISMPAEQGEDGYMVSMVDTSSAEAIQVWNPRARVVKAFATQASYVVDNPDVVGGPVTVPIASDDRDAKEEIGRIVAAMGMDPVDAGPLRIAREIEALQRLYMVPLIQRRTAAWEP
ncbi:MAG: NADPH-dependent F420 reductase, partial [Woeseiaceae bacterium]